MNVHLMNNIVLSVDVIICLYDQKTRTCKTSMAVGRSDAFSLVMLSNRFSSSLLSTGSCVGNKPKSAVDHNMAAKP